MTERPVIYPHDVARAVIMNHPRHHVFEILRCHDASVKGKEQVKQTECVLCVNGLQVQGTDGQYRSVEFEGDVDEVVNRIQTSMRMMLGVECTVHVYRVAKTYHWSEKPAT